MKTCPTCDTAVHVWIEERDAAIARAEKAEAAIGVAIVDGLRAELAAAERARDEALSREEGAVADALSWRSACDELGIQLAAAQAETARMRPVVEAARRVVSCESDQDVRIWSLGKALAALDTVPGDALAPGNVKGGE